MVSKNTCKSLGRNSAGQRLACGFRVLAPATDIWLVLIRRMGKPWGPPEVSSFIREGLLQEMLAESPEQLLELGEPVAVVRELRTRGSSLPCTTSGPRDT